MIKKLAINQFKCVDSVELELAALNLFTGPNSTGKSTLIQALLLLAQCIRRGEMRHGESLLNGEFVKLGTAQDVRNIYTNRKQCKISIEMEHGQCVTGEMLFGENDEEDTIKLTNAEVFENFDIIYLNHDRVGVKDIYDKNMENVSRIGTAGEYAFDYLSRNKLEPLPEPDFSAEVVKVGSNLGNQVDYWLEYIMGYRVLAEGIESTNYVRVVYQKAQNNRKLRPYHIGTGVSYVANVIVAALSCKKGSIFIVENPEIHLHPAAQSKLLEFCAYLSTRGLQIFVETHSDHIFNGVRKLLHKGIIKKEDTAVYFMVKNEMECSEAVRIEITGEGKIKNQQKGLFDQFDDDLDELLDLNVYE